MSEDKDALFPGDADAVTPENLTVENVTPEQVQPLLEALLLMAEGPQPLELLAQAVQAPPEVVADALRGLAGFYDETGRGFQLRDVGGGWALSTRPEHYEALARWVVDGQPNRLTQAGLETLSVIAYLQPVARSRVSAVRGVNVDSAVRTLLARDLIEESGADEQSGASLLRTTDYFLARLGLTSLDDLPPLSPHLPDAAELAEELAGLVPDQTEPELPSGHAADEAEHDETHHDETHHDETEGTDG